MTPEQRTKKAAREAAYWNRPENRGKKAARLRDMHLRRAYGINQKDVDKMFALQGGRCAGCGVEMNADGRSLHSTCVDHSHVTGRVRSLLCRACNSFFGMAKEDPAKIAGLLRYAEKWSSKGE